MLGRESATMRSIRVITGAMLVTWLVLPLIPLAIWFFSRSWFFPDLLPSVWSTQAWDYALSDTSQVMDSLGITIVISLGATALSVLAGVPAGRALGLYNFRGKQLVEPVHPDPADRRGPGGDPAAAAVQLRDVGEERRDRRNQHDLHPAGDRHPGADRASPFGAQRRRRGLRTDMTQVANRSRTSTRTCASRCVISSAGCSRRWASPRSS